MSGVASAPALASVQVLPRVEGLGRPALVSQTTMRALPGSKSYKKRLGRGQGNGYGKKCGRGEKGQLSRSGNSGGRVTFQGGQTELYAKWPKRGGKGHHHYQKPNRPLNLDELVRFVKEGRIDARAGRIITLKSLWDANIVGRFKYGVKLLARGASGLDSLGHPLHIHVTDVSHEAKQAIEARGGSVTRVYFTRIGLRAHLMPHKYPVAALRPNNGLPKPKQYWKTDVPEAIRKTRVA